MTFNELIDLMVDLTLAELIQLFLLGYDDKIYFNIEIGEDEVFHHIRIIDGKLQPYYDRKIAYLGDSVDCSLTAIQFSFNVQPSKSCFTRQS